MPDFLHAILQRFRLRQKTPALAHDDKQSEGSTGERVVSDGVVVRDEEVSDQYLGVVRRSVKVIGLQRGQPIHDAVLNVFEAQDVAVTTIYLPIDVKNGRLFINLTYEGVLHFWNPRAKIVEGRYHFDAEAPIVFDRKTVVLGGPIDGNYFHWILNWLARIAIVQMLRPDILADPRVAFLVDWRAKVSPFIDFLQVLGLGDDRLIWADHNQDYLLRNAVLVSFGSQQSIAPAVVATLRDMFAPLGRQVAVARRRRLWISRQQLGPNRRRIDNIADIRPLLNAYGLEEIVLEDRSVAEQIALFQGAEFIASIHGAGLTNIIFSSPDCRVLALDSSVHVKFGASLFYEALAKACGLDYRSLRVSRAPRPEGVERNVANMHNQDLIVPVDKLDAILREMLRPPLTGA